MIESRYCFSISLSHIGLPVITEDVYYKRKVPIPVRKLLAEFPKDTQKILDKIPGLEEIGEILQRVDVQPRFEEYDDRNIRISASILKVCLDFDFYEEQGHDKQLILSSLKSRPNDYDPKVIKVLELVVSSSEKSTKLEELPAKQLETGMRLVDELRMKDGFLLASAGSYIYEQLYKVIRNYLSCYDENPFPSTIKVLSQDNRRLDFEVELIH